MFWWNSLNELNWPEVSSSICSIWIIWIESFATFDTIVYLFVFFQPQYNQTVISDSSEQWAFYGCWHFLQQQPVLFSAFSENVLNSDRRAEVLHVTAVTCNSDKQSRLPDNLFFHHTEIAEANLVNTSATNSQQIRNFNCGYCSTFVCVYFPCLPSLFTHTHTHTDMVLITNSIFIWKEEKLHICHLKLTADPHSSGIGGKNSTAPVFFISAVFLQLKGFGWLFHRWNFRGGGGGGIRRHSLKAALALHANRVRSDTSQVPAHFPQDIRHGSMKCD